MATYSPQQLGIQAPSGGFQQGGWYSGRQYWGGTLSDPGVIHPQSNQQGSGQAVSGEVRSQSASQQGVGLSDFNQFIDAQNIQSVSSIPHSSGAQSDLIIGLNAEVENARGALETELSRQQTQNETRMTQARQREEDTLDTIEPLTQPFREDLETEERERLYVNENFEANQQLVNELEQLLTEGNEYIRQQQEITGLAAVRNPRIQKAMDEVAARVGVIEAVINARNGQISQAYNMIDRSINAIAQDRQDQINYYSTVLELNNRDIISLDNDSKRLAQEQLNLKKNDLARAEATADYVKQLLIDPATSLLMSQAGVTLNDSVEQINVKLAGAQYQNEVREQANEIMLKGGVAVVDPSTVPSSQLRSFTDSRGQIHYYKLPKSSASGDSSDISAKDYLEKNTGGGTTKSTSTSGPGYSPSSGVGSVWVDPQTGEIWQYSNSGWKKIG